jgi:hypothetical protein
VKEKIVGKKTPYNEALLLKKGTPLFEGFSFI